MTFSREAVIIEPVAVHKASIIWLHGLGADGHDFEPIVPELSIPDALGVKFVFPHAPVRPVTINGGMSMRAWYDVRNIDLRKQEDPESIYESADLLKTMLDAEISAGIPAEKILLAGFSQGGAMALHTGLRYPSKLAGVLALSAYLPLRDRFTGEASTAGRSTPIMMCHGQFDPVIPETAGSESCRFLQENGYTVTWHNYPMPHSVCIEEIKDISKWLLQIFE